MSQEFDAIKARVLQNHDVNGQIQRYIMPMVNWLYYPPEIRFKAFERFCIMAEQSDTTEEEARRYVRQIMERIKAGKKAEL